MDPLEKVFEADLARIEAEVAREAKASHSMVGTHHVDARESYCGDGQTSNVGDGQVENVQLRDDGD